MQGRSDRTGLLFALTALMLAALAARQAGREPAEASFLVPPAPALADVPATSRFVAPAVTGVAHAPSVVERDDGSLVAVWFEGSDEGAPDVRLRSATFSGGEWGPAHDITDSAATGREIARYVNTVGNPVILRHPDGRYWLIYVSVSIGGWAGSALNFKTSRDGITWGPATRLVTSPFLNLSTLVKAPPVFLSDGTIGLPAYHEMIGGFPEMVFVDPQGRVVDKVRMGGGWREAIQPWLVAIDDRRAIAFMRDLARKARLVWISETRDAGRSWSRHATIPLPNPNSPVAVVRLADGRFVMALNDDPAERTLVRLAVSPDGEAWTRAGIVEDGRATGARHRYHWLMQTRDGRLHLFNSAYGADGSRRIKHWIFGAAALATGADEHVR